MEFKRKLVKKSKSRQAKRYKDEGRVRVKVRGRKRWLKVGEKATSEA